MTKDENDTTVWNMAPLRAYRQLLVLSQLFQWQWGITMRNETLSPDERIKAGWRQRDAYRDIVYYRANIDRLEAAGHVDAPHGPLSAEQRLADWVDFAACNKRVLAEFPPD